MRALALAAALSAALLSTLGGCDFFASEARVRFTIFQTPGRLEPGMVTIRFSDGGRTRILRGETFAGSSGRFDSPEFRTRPGGRLAAAFLVVASTDTIATGAVELPLHEDWRWGVDLFLQDRNPIDTCFGCVGYEAFPVGNSISNPVVY